MLLLADGTITGWLIFGGIVLVGVLYGLAQLDLQRDVRAIRKRQERD